MGFGRSSLTRWPAGRTSSQTSTRGGHGTSTGTTTTPPCSSILHTLLRRGTSRSQCFTSSTDLKFLVDSTA